MRKIRKKLKQGIALFLIAAMLSGNLPVNTLSVYAQEQEAEILTEIPEEEPVVIDEQETDSQEEEKPTVLEEREENVSGSEEVKMEEAESNTSPSLEETESSALPPLENTETEEENSSEEEVEETIEESKETEETKESQEQEETVEGEVTGEVSDNDLENELLSILEENITSTEEFQVNEYSNGTGINIMCTAYPFSEENLITLLKSYDKVYDYVQIHLPDDMKIMSKDLWNAVVGITNNGGLFMPSYAESSHQLIWGIKNPRSTNSDVSLQIDWNLKGTGKGMEFSFPNTNFPGDTVHLTLNSNLNNEGNICDDILEAFGSEGDLTIKGEDGSSFLNYSSRIYINGDFVYVQIYDVEKMADDVTYLVSLVGFSPYTVTEENGSLKIQNSSSRKTPFTEQELLEILDSYKDKKFKSISVTDVKTSTNTIYASVTNQMVEMLLPSSSTHAAYISYYYMPDEEGVAYQWMLTNPEGNETADANLSSNLFINEEDKIILHTTPLLMKGTERKLSIYATNGHEYAENLVRLLGDKECYLGKVGGDLNGNYYVAAGYGKVIMLTGMENAVAEKDYIMNPDPYFGSIKDNILYLDAEELIANGETYTETKFVQILNSYEKGGTAVTSVDITLPMGSNDNINKIPKNIYNAAMELLSGEGNRSLYFRFRNEEKNICWIFEHGQAIGSDLNLKYEIGQKGTKALGLTYSIPSSSALKGATVHFEIEYYDETSFAEQYKKILGEGTAELKENFHLVPAVDERVNFTWEKTGQGFKLGVTDVDRFTANKKYTLAPYELATVWLDMIEGDEKTFLRISSMDIGQDTFAAGELEQYLSRYLNSGFNEIYLEQKDAGGKNVISKEHVNLLRGMLKLRDRKVVFRFQTIDSSDASIAQETEWILIDPNNIEKDFTATTPVTKAVGQGMKVKVSALSNLADCLEIRVRAKENSSTGKDLLETMGQVSVDQEKDILIMEKSTNPRYDMRVDYFKGEDNFLYFYIPNVADFANGLEYLVAPLTVLGKTDAKERLFIGAKDNAEKLSGNQIAEGTKVSWTSFATDRLSISSKGEVEALSTGEVYYKASYKEGSVAKIMFFKNQVDRMLQSMRFNSYGEELELFRKPEVIDGGTTIYGDGTYLDVLFYPTFCGIDQMDLIWTVEDGKDLEGNPKDGSQIVELEEVLFQNDDGSTVQKKTGFVMAKSEGTVTVRATLPEAVPVIGERSIAINIRVAYPETIPADETPDNLPEQIVAVTNFVTTLGEVEIPSGNNWEGSYAWKYPETKLADFVNLEEHSFAAIYRTKQGREIETVLPVRFATLQGIEIRQFNGYEMVPYSGSIVSIGEDLVLGDYYKVFNGGPSDLRPYFNRLEVKWSSSPNNILMNAEVVGNTGRKIDTSTKGTKQITVTLTDLVTKKKISTSTVKVTVVDKPVIDFSVFCDEYGEINTSNVILDTSQFPQLQKGDKGTLILRLTEENYHRLTVKSIDSDVLKLSNPKVDTTSEYGYVLTKIPYEVKNYGPCYIMVTAADGINSSIRLLLGEAIDYRPVYDGTVLNLNKALSVPEDNFRIELHKNTWVDKSSVRLEGDLSEVSSLGIRDNGSGNEIRGTLEGSITFNYPDQKNGKYKLKLVLDVYAYQGGVPTCVLDDYSIELSLNIKEEVPTVTVKQTQKVNTFYNDETGYGVLEIVTGEAISDNFETKLYGVGNKDCDYDLKKTEEVGKYLIYSKDPTMTSNKRGIVEFQLEGYKGTIQKNITISTEHKAPNIGFSKDKHTFYPALGETAVFIPITDKATGRELKNCSISYAGSNGIEELVHHSQGSPLRISAKNFYNVSKDESGIFVGALESYPVTDKLTFAVKQDNWSEWVKLNISFTTSAKIPKLVMDNKSMTLNSNSEVFFAQAAESELIFEGSKPIGDHTGISFQGLDLKSREALNNMLRLYYDRYNGKIVAKFNARDSKEIKDGTYKFRVRVDFGQFGQSLTSDFTIKVQNKETQKAISLTKKGSIDLLDRAGTYVSYTPKISDLDGTITGAYLGGKDSHLFRTKWDGVNLLVYAIEGQALSTKVNYEIIPIFYLQNTQFGTYTASAKAEKIKPTQGKPTVQTVLASTILYEKGRNELDIDFTALLNKTVPVKIKEIRLLNYTSDLEIIRELPVGEKDYGKKITLSQTNTQEIAAKGKTWKVKFEVIFEEKAGNEKTVEVTCPITIK